MNNLIYFIPTKQALLIGAGIGIATKSLAIGIIILFLFGMVAYIKSKKSTSW
ncbi:MAG: hypothetical protein K9H61_09690 [Bacteroidia bacterium]|nr:hypothetical protein [Bacteroidia bacterium]MCF8425149.1 hypothetical protein [Bacteroidia bacterium]MCF8447253.1 hypothetical protein [Bacteroidia bacterium]